MFRRRALRPGLALLGALSCALAGCGDVTRPEGDQSDACPLPSAELSSLEAADASRCAMRARGDHDFRLVLLD